MERLMRDHTRQVVGGVLIVVAAVVLLVGYANIRDETAVAIQMPYVLTGGIGALILTGLGMVILRSQDDKAVLERLNQVEAVNEELRERVDYLTQLLEAALLPDEAEPKVTTRRQATTASAPATS
jgi:Cu/Ag efflux pump CusA